MAGAIFLCSRIKLHGCHAAKPLLASPYVVEIYVLFNGICQFLIAHKLFQIVHFRFQDTPESFHRAVVNASANCGHALYYLCFAQFGSGNFTCVLESTVAVKQRMCVGMLVNRFVKCIEHELVIIACPNLECHDPSVIQVKDRT